MSLSEWGKDLDGDLTTKEMMKRVQEIKTKWIGTLLVENPTSEREKWSLAYVYGVVMTTRQMLVKDKHKNGDTEWIDVCMLMVEETIMSKFHSIRNGDDSVSTTHIPVARATISGVNPSRICSAFASVLEFYIGQSRATHRCAIVSVLIHLGLTLSICWLLTNSTHEATQLLTTTITICEQKFEEAKESSIGRWPLFLLAMIYWIEHKDAHTSVQLMQRAHKAFHKVDNTKVDVNVGIFYYWSAVVLSQNGLTTQAIEQLESAVQWNQDPIPSLSLSALLSMLRKDYYGASKAIERCIEMEDHGSVSMVNYALLLQHMGHTDAQYQMLEYYVEAMNLPVVKSKANPSNSRNYNLELFEKYKLDTVIPVRQHQVEHRRVLLTMANAAMENGQWEDAREHFTEFMSLATDYPTEEDADAMNDYVYVLLQCNRPAQALKTCDAAVANRSSFTDPLSLHFLKADALLCLERVDECISHLENVLQPLIKGAPGCPVDVQIQSQHIQLLNNIAVASVCHHNNVERAIQHLRKALRIYPQSQVLQFNLVLLLFRSNQREAACIVWFELRGWDLKMHVGGFRDQTKALEFVNKSEEAALKFRPLTFVTSHVEDCEHGIPQQQLIYVDALVLNYWGTLQQANLVQTTTQYLEHLNQINSKQS